MSDFSFIPPTSVHNIPGAHVSAAFTTKTSEVFKEENDIAPIIINDKTKYIPWGGDNRMPYKISALTILQYINFINNKPIGRIKYALIPPTGLFWVNYRAAKLTLPHI